MGKFFISTIKHEKLVSIRTKFSLKDKSNLDDELCHRNPWVDAYKLFHEDDHVKRRF